ncbi:Survival protein SurA precursor (Peptidyl-prolyl cis-trans isomerase SurA) [hydrothermal vent metagenome]|uniref:Survival protein SurA (Peptidyl-prolyl cis-trans isomerase SurA) n=1 Tax=hydrothermal vent metagenome TaxID=652676 RepID=A0A1W1D6G6_9ZZZZ
MTNPMKALFALAITFTFSLNTLAAPNSIIAIVNDEIITFDTISDEIKPSFTKAQKIKLVDRQIDLALQLVKIEKFGIKPKLSSVNTMLSNIASQNGLTLVQLQANNQFDEIVDNVSQRLSLRGLKQFVLQKADTNLTQAEIDTALAKNPSNSDNFNKQIKIAQIVISSVDQTDSLLQSKDSLIQQLLIELSDKINAGTSFSSLAKLHSQDPSYKNGGESGWLDENRLPAVFKQHLSQLKADELSPPFQTQQGWRVIKIIDKRRVDNHLIAVKSKLIQSKKNSFFKNWVKELRKGAYIEIFDHKL